MVNGSWLDFYCIGPLGRQEDRTGLNLAAEIYRFHVANEAWLANTVPAGEIGLVRRGEAEYEGILQVLSENQMAFELTELNPDRLQPDRFSVVIVPDAGGLDNPQAAALDDYVKHGGRVLLTGRVPDGLYSMGSAKLVETRSWDKGAYVRIRPEDKGRLQQPILDELDLVFLRGRFQVYQTAEDVEGLLRLIPADMFGPPEKCYYRSVSEHPALLMHRHGRGAVACFTFDLGTHYRQQCHQGHAALLSGAIDELLQVERRLRVRTSPLVEINHRADPDGRFEWVSLYNHSGQRGQALHEPIPVSAIEVSLAPAKPVQAVRCLRTGQELTVEKQDGGRIHVVLPRLELFEIVVFQYGDDARAVEKKEQLAAGKEGAP
jgi:hypothetical protein